MSHRTQQTRVGSSLSANIDLTSGIVQGSVLGPLLFVLFINDITNLFTNNSCKCKLYADDVKLYTVLETTADCGILQSKLDEICNWSKTWQLSISYAKCNVMCVGNLNCNFNFNINTNILTVVDKVKDLGIIVDSHLTFDAHINNIVSRAFIRANLIHKCFMSRNVDNLKRAFIVYVRPLLEYGSCVWSPHHVGKIKQVESVQRRFTKRLLGFAVLDYRSRLQKLNIESLEMRRLRQDLVYTYKILFGLTDQSSTDFFTLTNSVHSAFTRGHRYKLFPTYNRVDLHKYFFSNRVIKSWNSLPAKEEHFRSLSVFKRFIRAADLTAFVTLGF